MSQPPTATPDRLSRLDARHRELLQALDELNARVEQVIRDFTRSDGQSPAAAEK